MSKSNPKSQENRDKETTEEFCKRHGIPYRNSTKELEGKTSVMFINKKRKD